MSDKRLTKTECHNLKQMLLRLIQSQCVETDVQLVAKLFVQTEYCPPEDRVHRLSDIRDNFKPINIKEIPPAEINSKFIFWTRLFYHQIEKNLSK